LEFLQAKVDEGMHVDSFLREAQQWLSEKHDLDLSLWDDMLFKTRTRIIRQALHRRAGRVELWVLHKLMATCSGTQSSHAHNASVRVRVQARLQQLMNKMPCSRQCSTCKLQCSLYGRHHGICDCGTDHLCHARIARGMCQHQAGHEGLHYFPAPPPPPTPLRPPSSQNSVVSPTVSLPNMVSPRSTLPLLQASGGARYAVGAAPHKAMTIDDLRNSWVGTCKICEDGSAACAICLEPLVGSVEELHCKHAFHSGCILPWVRDKGLCPLCRFQAKKATIQEAIVPAQSAQMSTDVLPGMSGSGNNGTSRTRRTSSVTNSLPRRAQYATSSRGISTPSRSIRQSRQNSNHSAPNRS
jgi:hypothetical protein